MVVGQVTSTGRLALVIALAVWAGPASAAERIRKGNLGVGQCASLGDARLCIGETYWATLTVAGREVDFMAGGKVAEMPGLSVTFEMGLDGDRYRVKVEDWSTADVDFARFSEIRFRKRSGRFELTGYTAKGFSPDCELGVDYSSNVDFVTGRQVADVGGKRLFVGPRIPAKLRTPDLFRFKEEQLYKPYKLYDGLAEATKKYCENQNG